MRQAAGGAHVGEPDLVAARHADDRAAGRLAEQDDERVRVFGQDDPHAGVAAHLVMRAEDRLGLLDEQRQVVGEVFTALLERAPSGLDRSFRDDWAAAPDDRARRRVVVDQVASLTDASIMTWRRALT